jgi:hypothetical protein
LLRPILTGPQEPVADGKFLCAEWNIGALPSTHQKFFFTYSCFWQILELVPAKKDLSEHFATHFSAAIRRADYRSSSASGISCAA